MLMFNHVNVPLPLGHTLGQQTAFQQQDDWYISQSFPYNDLIALLIKENMNMDVNVSVWQNMHKCSLELVMETYLFNVNQTHFSRKI